MKQSLTISPPSAAPATSSRRGPIPRTNSRRTTRRRSPRRLRSRTTTSPASAFRACPTPTATNSSTSSSGARWAEEAMSGGTSSPSPRTPGWSRVTCPPSGSWCPRPGRPPRTREDFAPFMRADAARSRRRRAARVDGRRGAGQGHGRRARHPPVAPPPPPSPPPPPPPPVVSRTTRSSWWWSPSRTSRMPKSLKTPTSRRLGRRRGRAAVSRGDDADVARGSSQVGRLDRLNAPVPLDATYDAARGGGSVLELRHGDGEGEEDEREVLRIDVAAASVGGASRRRRRRWRSRRTGSGRRRKNFGKGESDVRVSFR